MTANGRAYMHERKIILVLDIYENLHAKIIEYYTKIPDHLIYVWALIVVAGSRAVKHEKHRANGERTLTIL
jgi:hypothetical protein